MPISAVMHKVERAKEHLDSLREAIELWRKSHLQSISAQDNPETGEYLVEIHPPQFDLRMALIAGDFVSCLRASLDHLVWQMYFAAHPDSKEPVPKRLGFPVYEVKTIDTEMAFVKCTFGLPDEAIAIIRSMQPYQSTNAEKIHYLWILNTLWNIDKHRHITMHSAITTYNFGSGTPHPLRQDNFDDHAKIYFSLADKPKVKFEPFTTEVIF